MQQRSTCLAHGSNYNSENWHTYAPLSQHLSLLFRVLNEITNAEQIEHCRTWNKINILNVTSFRTFLFIFADVSSELLKDADLTATITAITHVGSHKK